MLYSLRLRVTNGRPSMISKITEKKDLNWNGQLIIKRKITTALSEEEEDGRMSSYLKSFKF